MLLLILDFELLSGRCFRCFHAPDFNNATCLIAHSFKGEGKMKIKKRKKSTLFRRYFKSSVITVLVAFIFFGFTLMIFIAGQWWNDKVENLTDNARNISDIYTDMLDGKTEMDEGFIKSTLNTINMATVSDYFISDLNGKVILCADENNTICNKHAELEISADHISRAIDGGFSDYSSMDEFGEGRFLVAVPVKTDNKPVAIVFAVEDAITGLLPYISSIMAAFWVITLITLIIVFTAIFFITKGITDPLSEMEAVTSHIAKGDFSHRVKGNYKNRDFTQFANSLNKMADELAIEDESRKNFVANVSHELKTPMTSIAGFIDGILDGTIPPEDEKKYLRIVSTEVKRLSRMVVSMLNLSKIEAGEISINLKEYDIANQIFETLLSFEKRIDDGKINISGFENMGVVPVKADKDLIQQVLYNLIDNAVKFTPTNGTIELFAKNDGEKTTVIIRNSGHGVESGEISRIFERFYKVDKSRSYDTKGVGLGLYIVKTIVNMHDGEIHADSKLNQYTEFCFSIPYSTD